VLQGDDDTGSRRGAPAGPGEPAVHGLTAPTSSGSPT
jgi:hypothetical protein